jgi:hypothetical protein
MQALHCPHRGRRLGGLAAPLSWALTPVSWSSTLPSRSPQLPWLRLPPQRPCGPPLWPMAPVPRSPPSWPTSGGARHPAGPAPLRHPKRCPPLLPPVILVPSSLVPLLGRHHPGESDAGAGVRLRHTSTFVVERMVPASWSPMTKHTTTRCVAWQRRRQGLVRKRTTTRCVAQRRQQQEQGR